MKAARFIAGLIGAFLFVWVGATTGDPFWIVVAVILLVANVIHVIVTDRVPKATTYRDETDAAYTAPTPRHGDTFAMTDIDGVTYVCTVVRPMHAEPIGHMCVADHPKYGRIEVTVDPRSLTRDAG